MSSFVVTIDQGSSATKALGFDHQGRQTYRSSRPLKIERLKPGHVEQNPIHVLEETRLALDEVLSSTHAEGHEVEAIGFWKEIQDLFHGDQTFHPQISQSECQNLLNGWHKFLKDQGL